jgi:hypothetical protein
MTKVRSQSVFSTAWVLAGAWFVLVVLTAVSMGAGRLFHGADWLPFGIAAIVWVKASLIARYFLEGKHIHPFLRWALRVFIAFVPIWLVLSAVLGERLARLTTL